MATELQRLIEQFNYDEAESRAVHQDGNWEALSVQVVDGAKLLSARKMKNKALMPSRS